MGEETVSRRRAQGIGRLAAGVLSLAVAGPAAAQSPCPLWEIRPAGDVIAVDFGEHLLPRASLVQSMQGMLCIDEKVAVRVRSVHHWYRVPDGDPPDLGAVGCIDKRMLHPVSGMQLVGIGLPMEGSSVESGLELGQYTTSRIGVPTCGEQDVPMRPAMSPMPLESLAHTRAVDRSQVVTIRAMGGQTTPYRVPGQTPIQTFSDWGFVSMPVVQELSEDERQQVWQDEDLLTEKQREKATVAIGARTTLGHVIYTRFLGSDARRSDRWGTPHTVRKLVDLAARWYTFCSEQLPSTVPSANNVSCTIQFGDLAWYNSRQPDPLGHTTHHDGTCVDIRLFRSDGSRYEAYWNRPDDRPGWVSAYDPALTRAFLHFANENLALDALYFNDPALIESVPGLEARKGHDDHIHLCVEAEGDPQAVP
jgi:hypothetical protein